MAKPFSLWGLLTKAEDNLTYNELSFVNYYKWLKGLAISIYEWQGLPETVNVRYLENTLFNKGRLLFFLDETLGHLALSCLAASDVNIYGEPIKWHVHSYTYDKNVLASESVLIRNNDQEEPTRWQIGEIGRAHV